MSPPSTRALLRAIESPSPIPRFLNEIVGWNTDFRACSLNPGPEWSVDKGYARPRMRLCFANPSHEAIRAGVAALAEVCRKEFGVPERIANVERRAGAAE